jgi:hypothetical protein
MHEQCFFEVVFDILCAHVVLQLMAVRWESPMREVKIFSARLLSRGRWNSLMFKCVSLATSMITGTISTKFSNDHHRYENNTPMSCEYRQNILHPPKA